MKVYWLNLKQSSSFTLEVSSSYHQKNAEAPKYSALLGAIIEMELEQRIRKRLNLMIYEAIGASYTYMQPVFTNLYNEICIMWS